MASTTSPTKGCRSSASAFSAAMAIAMDSTVCSCFFASSGSLNTSSMSPVRVIRRRAWISARICRCIEAGRRSSSRQSGPASRGLIPPTPVAAFRMIFASTACSWSGLSTVAVTPMRSAPVPPFGLLPFGLAGLLEGAIRPARRAHRRDPPAAPASPSRSGLPGCPSGY